ncbi:hypothetical protein L21TH_1520 [Caldisalinibacter kiritimatiensis]|uniref:Uncharacterized protein n=2 Tax=Caldisalinibacter kiritimatiensis TaxID=1304284 RepID=R1CDP7_9FIRM|nr:hypothetical protein L21TH_1520 [Caldisalinibacter kiritimatiensis]
MPLNQNFIIELQGKSYVTYEGLLDLAHQNNLRSISVELIQIPKKENNMTAICKATAITDKGTYTDYGDANPQSVNTTIVPHLIRMASTRAKARTLRDLTNIGITAIEELNLDNFNNECHEYNQYNDDINTFNPEPPTQRQIETIKKLSDSLNININYETLTKKTAGQLISKMLNEKYRKH